MLYFSEFSMLPNGPNRTGDLRFVILSVSHFRFLFSFLFKLNTQYRPLN